MKEKILPCLAIIIAAVILAFGMANITKQERTVSVRGLSEHEVDADLAVWPLSFSVGNNSLQGLQGDIATKTESVLAFLQNHGLAEEDYNVQSPEITDYTMNAYLDRDRIPYNYVAKATVLVRSSKVQNVKQAQLDSLDLANDGIAVSQDYDSRISFEFTKLNDIKPEMIAEATQNAREAAEQFAHDSESRVGKIKTASQGLFSIEDAATGLAEKKNVRVVTTVVYYLR